MGFRAMTPAAAGILAVLLSFAAAALPPPSGTPAAEGHPWNLQAVAESPENVQAMTAGQVKKVDRDAGKVTISHEPIVNLGMPKMTMVFRVKDPGMLDRLKPGDRIRFIADKVNGAFTVMSFEPAE